MNVFVVFKFFVLTRKLHRKHDIKMHCFNRVHTKLIVCNLTAWEIARSFWCFIYLKQLPSIGRILKKIANLKSIDKNFGLKMRALDFSSIK